MKPIYSFLIFIIVAMTQIYVPAEMIWQQERVLDEGTLYKFRTQPIDPADPFRGKYITLNFEVDEFYTTEYDWERNQDVYVSLVEDSLGFAKVQGVSKDIPSHANYVKAKVNYFNKRDEKLYFDLPFDRFYMNENKAQPAEDAYRNSNRDSFSKPAFAIVYIKNGEAVLEDVMIDGVSIIEYVEK